MYTGCPGQWLFTASSGCEAAEKTATSKCLKWYQSDQMEGDLQEYVTANTFQWWWSTRRSNDLICPCVWWQAVLDSSRWRTNFYEGCVYSRAGYGPWRSYATVSTQELSCMTYHEVCDTPCFTTHKRYSILSDLITYKAYICAFSVESPFQDFTM